jgi:signal transduction histidine kinase
MASLGDADRLESTIRELLTLAREQPAVRSAPTDLKMLLREMEPEWREPLARQGRDLVVTADRQVPDPCASAATIRQILSVLADNAATHGAGTVTISLREAPNAVAIDVTDEGPGIDAPASVLFARAADQRNGHGIGLALARRLAEAAGGKLDLAQQSPPTFTLLLPSERPDG